MMRSKSLLQHKAMKEKRIEYMCRPFVPQELKVGDPVVVERRTEWFEGEIDFPSRHLGWYLVWVGEKIDPSTGTTFPIMTQCGEVPIPPKPQECFIRRLWKFVKSLLQWLR